MKVKEDFIYAQKQANGLVIMYLDELCTQPYVNSMIYDGVCECMKDMPVGDVEMICFDEIE